MKIKRKIIYRFIISYSIILIFALLINLFAFYNYQRETTSQSESYVQIILSQIQFSFDEKIQNVHGIISSIDNNPSVRSFMLTGGALDNYVRYNSYEIVNALRRLTNSYRYVDSIIIAFNDFDTYATGSSMFYSMESFRTHSDNMYWDEYSWRALFDDVGFVKYTGPLEIRDRDIYTVIRPVILGSAGIPSTHVLVNFNIDAFWEQIEDIIDLQNGLIFISNRYDNVIMSLGSDDLLEHVSTDGMFTPSTSQVTIMGQRYTQHLIFSQNSGLRYVFLLPVENFFSRGINQLIIFLSVSMILLGGVICFAAARFNANPITRFAELIANRNPLLDKMVGKDRNHNELEYIFETVGTAVHEYANIRNEFNRYIPTLQTTLISDILKGKLILREDIDQELEVLGIEFPFDWYSVVLFEYRGDGGKTLVEYNYINIQLRNLINDFFAGSGTVYICDLDVGVIGCLLNLDYSMEDKSKEINEGMIDLIRHMLETYGTVTTITAGGSSAEFLEIARLYANAADAMAHQLFNAPGQFAFFSDIHLDQDSFVISTSDQNYLIANIKAGHVDNVMTALSEILKGITREPAMSPAYIKYNYVDLVMLLQKTSTSLGFDAFSQYDIDSNPLNVIYQNKSANIIQEMVVSFYQTTVTEISTRMENHKIPLAENIKTYISENYDNPLLSLNLAAEQFNFNPSYLSTYFKKSTGENFANYVNALRLENARKLLEEENLRVAEIAERVGFSNSSIFITNFRKVYGVTPGAYQANTVQNGGIPKNI